MPASRPRMSPGWSGSTPSPRKTAEIMSAAPAQASSTIATQMDGARPTSPMQPVEGGGDDDRPAVVVDPGGPAAARGRDHGADGLGGVEQAEQLGALEESSAPAREEHDRHRQQHGGDVDEVGAEQVRRPAA